MGKYRYPILLVALAATAFVAYGVLFGQTPAPAQTFVTLKGEKIATSDLRGKVVLVNFWATDCAVCAKELPQMIETHKKFQPRGLETVAVAMQYDPPNYVIQYTEKNALPFKVALDPLGAHAKAFGDVKFTPTTFVIDKRGNIVDKIVGEPNFATLHALVGRLLSEG